MPTNKINPNNAGTIKMALAGITPLVEYGCQVTACQAVPTANTTTTPGTYCGPPVDTPGLSSWALEISFLQDWGYTPSFSQFTFDNDGALCDFEFEPTNPTTVPAISGSLYMVATPYGGDPGADWQVTTARWSIDGTPTITPDALLMAASAPEEVPEEQMA